MILLPDNQILAVRAMLKWTPPRGFENRLEHSHVGVVILTLADALVPEVIEGVTSFVISCIQPDGGLNDGAWPASETECAYSGLRALRLCGTLDHYPKRRELLEWILSKQNADGGFGAMCDWGKAYKLEGQRWDLSLLGFYQESCPHACFFAYGALDAIDATKQADLKKLEEYLLAAQKPDGGWPFFPTNEHSNPITTAMVLHVLDKLGALKRIDRQRAIDFLLACQREDGSFDGYPGLGRTHLQPLFTGRASKALRILNAFHMMDVWKLEQYWNAQMAEGGWNTICLAMSAGIPLVLQER